MSAAPTPHHSPFDVARARRDTPGTERVTHFNNAGASLPPRPVVDAVVNHLRLEETVGGYEAANQAAPQIQDTYAAIADLIHCRPDEVALVENATRAWDMAFYSFSFQPGDRIITAMSEYASNFISYLQVQKRTGVTIDVVPIEATGAPDVAALEGMIDDRVKLISVTHMPTNGGLLVAADAIGRVARAHGIPFLLDACQTVGQLPIDVEAIGCDMLSATGRKYLRGPRGTGFLYVRRNLVERLEPPFLDLRAATWVAPDRYEVQPSARRFENWESYVAGQVGLGVAARYALGVGLDAIWARVSALAAQLRSQLAGLPGVTLRDLGQVQGGIVTFTIANAAPTEVTSYLRSQRINTSVSVAEATLLDMHRRGLKDVIRASVHYYNTDAEIDRLIEVLGQHLWAKA